MLDDPSGGLERADLILQFEAARKLTAAHPGTLRSIGWRPWWGFTLARRIPRSGFDPPPSVDAAVLTVARRRPSFLPVEDRAAFLTMLARAFGHGSTPVRRSLAGALPPMTWKRLARDRGFAVDVRPPELDVRDWVAIFLARRPSRRTNA
jgi:23S rRNA (adenine-N6)-dimethyltransferase